jgi:hypothetical protein
MACHGSVRAGRHLSIAELNAMFGETDVTPQSGQCNHGRPTWARLAKTDIEKLFGWHCNDHAGTDGTGGAPVSCCRSVTSRRYVIRRMAVPPP